jgi:hypothetical protein
MSRRTLIGSLDDCGEVVGSIEFIEYPYFGRPLGQQIEDGESGMGATQDHDSTISLLGSDCLHEPNEPFELKNLVTGEHGGIRSQRILLIELSGDGLEGTSSHNDLVGSELDSGHHLSSLGVNLLHIGDPILLRVLGHLVDAHSSVVSEEDPFFEFLPNIVEHGIACIAQKCSN